MYIGNGMLVGNPSSEPFAFVSDTSYGAGPEISFFGFDGEEHTVEIYLSEPDSRIYQKKI